jgi:hypothetical protein
MLLMTVTPRFSGVQSGGGDRHDALSTGSSSVPAGVRGFLLPLPVQQPSVPGEAGARGDQGVAAQPSGQAPGQGCERDAVRPGKSWARSEPAAQQRDFVAERKQLDVLASSACDSSRSSPRSGMKSR